MKHKKKQWKGILSVSLIISSMLVSFLYIPVQFAIAITSYPPGSLLQPSDVTSSHIRNGVIINEDVSSTAAIAGSKLNLTGYVLDEHVSSTGAISVDKLATSSTRDFITPNAQTYAGIKTFSSIPRIPTSTPTNDADVVSKKYVSDTAISTAEANPMPTVSLPTTTTSTTLTGNGTYTVPAGVTSLLITLAGEKGDNGTQTGNGIPGVGGNGALATGTLAVSPGQIIYYSIGSKVGGGGFSWLSTSSATFSTSSVFMAVGGGGEGGNSQQDTGNGGKGGDGGTINGENGVMGNEGDSNAGGGTQSAAGTAGAYGGSAGALTVGGAGGPAISLCAAGGDGGDGFFGGGGGGTNNSSCGGLGAGGGGGGGGSGFLSPTLTSVTTSTNAGAGFLNIVRALPPTISGNNYGGVVSLVVAASTSTVTFGTQFSRAPACTVMTSQNAYGWGSTTSSTLSLTFSTTLYATSSFMYVCI